MVSQGFNLTETYFLDKRGSVRKDTPGFLHLGKSELVVSLNLFHALGPNNKLDDRISVTCSHLSPHSIYCAKMWRATYLADLKRSSGQRKRTIRIVRAVLYQVTIG